MIHVVLFEPEIPGNTGNIMRTCAGTGTKLHLIKPLGFSLDEKKVRRSGVNYLEYCDYCVYENFDDFMKQNPSGEKYYLTRYGTKAHTSFDFHDSGKDIYLVFGKESTGIPKAILKDHLDRCLRIPTNEHIRALNLSNCVAIMVFEVLRQQNYLDLLHYDTFKGEDYLTKD